MDFWQAALVQAIRVGWCPPVLCQWGVSDHTKYNYCSPVEFPPIFLRVPIVPLLPRIVEGP